MSINKGTMRIFMRDLKLDMSIGVYDFEKNGPQPVIINIEAGIIQPPDTLIDKLGDWVSYEALVNVSKDIAADGHIHMLETYAHRIADKLLEDTRITDVHIRLEKTEIIKETTSVGVDLYKSR